MKYLCLIYDEEKKMAAMPKPEADAFMGEYFAFTNDIRARDVTDWVTFQGSQMNAGDPRIGREDEPRSFVRVY